jgi:hypothetical protein
VVEQKMTGNMIDAVSLALFASDGMKAASRDVSLQQSWAMTPERHTEYRERAIVFIKVMGQQIIKLADDEIAQLDATRGR